MALAEAIATPKEIQAKLRAIAEQEADQALSDQIEATQARRRLEAKLNAYLDKHYFAGFGRKRMVDKVTARVLKLYKGKLGVMKTHYERAEVTHWQRCSTSRASGFCCCNYDEERREVLDYLFG